MKLLTDQEGKTMIENLCHIAMVNTARENFLLNMAAISQLLLSIELIPQIPDKEEKSPDDPDKKAGMIRKR